MVGLDRTAVGLVDYRETWPRQYECEVDRLRAAVGDRVRRFEHVGSTAIPGLAAKPVIDVLALVADLDGATELVDSLETAGYEFRPDGMDRLFFARGPETARTHYLHVAQQGSAYAREMLAFRDHLRTNPDAAAAYVDLKRDLAAQHPENRAAYTDHKSAFIEAVVDEAMGNGGRVPPNRSVQTLGGATRVGISEQQ